MLFSDHFAITKRPDDDWFDPFLNLDTKLFIDPFLLYDNESEGFIGCHREIISFFDVIFKLIAIAGSNRESASWKRALRLLYLPEVDEICLGYTSLGIAGAGSGPGIANRLANSILKTIEVGLQDTTHFEQIQLFENGIGPDRISDATATIIRHRLVTYTQKVCTRHNVPMRTFRTDRGIFDPTQERWLNRDYLLPENLIKHTPILLVPKRYLRHLPTINPDDFWDYCYDNHNRAIRDKFGDDIKRNVQKDVIIDMARSHVALMKIYLEKKETQSSNSYDIESDHQGLYQPSVQAYKWAREHPKQVQPNSDEALAAAIGDFITEFKNYVENNRGWKLLWNDDGTPKNEASFQALFMQTVATHCRANGIDISAEANIGRGPVDFKMSVGFFARVLVEAKLARNSKFWNGLERQLPKYLEAETIKEGFFIVCVQSEQDNRKIQEIQSRLQVLRGRIPYRIRVLIVDAKWSPPSASNLPAED